MKSRVEYSIQKTIDQTVNQKESAPELHSRRVWAQNFALISASAAVAWACGGSSKDSQAVAATYSVEDQKSDAATMNVALGLEHEAIAIYSAAAGLTKVWDTTASALAPALLEVAKIFLGHHTAHRDALIAQINLLKTVTSVSPVDTDTTANYITPYPGIADLEGPEGLLLVLQVAAEREMNAANAYHGVIKSFKNADLMQTLGGLSADEAGHYGVLNAAAFAHAFLIDKLADTKFTYANLVSAALPPFTYPRSVRA